MDLVRTHRFALLGALAALTAGGLIAYSLTRGHRGEHTPPPPASQGGLVIESTGGAPAKINPSGPLRCFVDGRLVGELSLADCARRNGVATDALGVGVDASGALSAAAPGAAAVTPLPPPAAQATASPPAVAGPALGACWRFADNRWSRLPSETTLNGCAQALFAGRCEHAGGATYGRWAQQTLRLAPGRIEISADNRNFRILIEQGPGCSVPGVG